MVVAAVMVSISTESHFSQSYGSFSSTLWLFIAFSNTDIRSCQRKHSRQRLVAGEEQTVHAENAKQDMANLIVRLSEVVQSQDMIQEGTKLRGKVLEHESMVICLF